MVPMLAPLVLLVIIAMARDARNRNTVRIPYVAWDKYNQDPKHPLEFGEKNSTVRH